jgi:hypothetical protein
MFTINFQRSPDAWRHNSELALLREDFYPDRVPLDPFAATASDRRHSAIDLVTAYLFRNPTTPHALAATSNLTEASIHDAQGDRASCISENAMKSIYAMAFVKFVNGFVDRDVARANTVNFEAAETDDTGNAESSGDEEAEIKAKVKGGGEGSMYAYASKIAMPEDFVDLRHSIVHGDIPSLDTLRNYNKRGLDWLWDKWWTKNVLGDSAKAKAAALYQQELADRARTRSREAWENYEQGSSEAADRTRDAMTLY